MAAPASVRPAQAPSVPPLQNGDRLTRAEFERRYLAMPRLKKAELIEGVVHMPSPVSVAHSDSHFDLVGWLYSYRAATPGVAGGTDGTVRLDMDNEPQPDGLLRIESACGGRSRVDADGYLEGAPELVAEIAASSVSYDLHAKLHVYRRNQVQEYVVWRVLDGAVDWFVQQEGRFERLPSGADGIYRSAVLPGLRLDPAALVRGDLATVMSVLQQGLGSAEHAAFVSHLKRTATQSST